MKAQERFLLSSLCPVPREMRGNSIVLLFDCRVRRTPMARSTGLFCRVSSSSLFDQQAWPHAQERQASAKNRVKPELRGHCKLPGLVADFCQISCEKRASDRFLPGLALKGTRRIKWRDMFLLLFFQGLSLVRWYATNTK